MENIGWVLLGMVIWQILVMVICLVSGQDEEKTGIAGMIIPWILLSIAGTIYKKVKLSYYRKNYSLCSFYRHTEKEEFGYHGGVGIKTKDIGKYYQKGENDYYINVYQDGKNWKSPPYETITKIRKNGSFCQEFVDTNFKKK